MIAFIPARGGSKSIPRKNIKLLGGKPLIVYTIEKAFASGISRVIVDTDDEEIAKIANEYGAEVMMRPAELAQDETSMFQVLKHEIPLIRPDPEIILLMSPTAPFRTVMHINAAINFFANQMEKYDSLMTVKRVPHEFNPAQVIISSSFGPHMADGRPLSNRVAKRQEYPNAYVTAGGLYLFKTSNLASGSFYGKNTLLMEIDPDIDINSPEDWERAEHYLLANSELGPTIIEKK